jgi:arsenic resistance protein ArsH
MGDLNNTAASREHMQLDVDPAYRSRTFALHPSEDNAEVRKRYRPFLLEGDISNSDWVAKLELSTALKMVEAEIISTKKHRLKVLVLYGSLRTRYFPYVDW